VGIFRLPLVVLSLVVQKLLQWVSCLRMVTTWASISSVALTRLPANLLLSRGFDDSSRRPMTEALGQVPETISACCIVPVDHVYPLQLRCQKRAVMVSGDSSLENSM
jgi:hypothetical protein